MVSSTQLLLASTLIIITTCEYLSQLNEELNSLYSKICPFFVCFYSCRIGARKHNTCSFYNTAYPVRSDLRNAKCVKHKITPKTIHADAVNLAFISITDFNQYLKRCVTKFVIISIHIPYHFKFLKSFAKFLMVVEFSLSKKHNVRLS